MTERPPSVPCRPWELMSETEKRQHLAHQHKFLPARLGGVDDDAWVLDGGGDEVDLNACHEQDHQDYPEDGAPSLERHHHTDKTADDIRREFLELIGAAS